MTLTIQLEKVEWFYKIIEKLIAKKRMEAARSKQSQRIRGPALPDDLFAAPAAGGKRGRGKKGRGKGKKGKKGKDKGTPADGGKTDKGNAQKGKVGFCYDYIKRQVYAG